EGRRRGGAGVVEEDVDPAPLRDHRIDEPLAVRSPADIGDLGEHLAAGGLANLVRRLVEMLLPARTDGHPRPLGGQLLRRGAAQPIAPAGDDGDLAVQSEIEHEQILPRYGLEEHRQVLGEQHTLVEDDLAAGDPPVSVHPPQQVFALADEEVGLRLHAVPVHDEPAPDVDLTRPRLPDLDIGDDVADSRGRLLRPVDARQNLAHPATERVLALVEPAGVETLPRELPLRLVARDIAPQGHPVVDVFGEELEPLLVAPLVKESGLPVEEALDLLLEEEPIERGQLGAHGVAISPQLSASMSWRQRV